MAAQQPFDRRARSNSKAHPPDLRLVLVGKTGSGKSSSGNTILGRDAFRVDISHISVTRQCQKKDGEVFEREVTLIDTPGLFDTSLSDDSVKREISKCINMSTPGPHAILLVIKVGPFTKEERHAVMKVEEVFGEDAWKCTIILFTHGDKVEKDFDKQLAEEGDELKSILEKAGNRYQLLNNLKMNQRGQVLELLEKVDKMVEANEGKFYSNYTYEQVTEMLKQRESELRELYKKKLEEEIQAVETRYEKMLSEAQNEREKMESELKELKRYYRVLESGARHFVEQTVPTDSFSKVVVKIIETQRLNLTS